MATCSKWICDPDTCFDHQWTDELDSAASQEEEVKIDSSTDLSSPTAPYIRVGSVTFEITFKFGSPISSKVSSVSLSPSISLTNNLIPQSVISKAIEWMNDNCESWLNGVSDTDGLLEYFSRSESVQDHQDMIDFSTGWRDSTYLPNGSNYGQNVYVRTVTLDYYTTGKLEGCEAGTSNSYGKDDYKCGYGQFTIDNNLHYARPDYTADFSNLTFAPTLNNDISNTASLLESAASGGISSLANSADSYMNGTYACIDMGSCWANVNGQSSINSNNGVLANGNVGYLFGNGIVKFGGWINFADPNFKNQALWAGFQGTDVDWAIWDQDNPYEINAKGTTYAVGFGASLGTIATQAADFPEAFEQTGQLIGGLLQSVFGQSQSHTTSIITTVITIMEGNDDRGVDPGKAQGEGTLIGDGATINIQTGINTTGDGGFGCWLARAAYGQDSIEWRKFRKYIETFAPEWLAEIYNNYAPKIAKNIRNSKTGILKNIIKAWMNTKIRNIAL